MEDLYKLETFSLQLAGRELVIETGKMAGQAGGARLCKSLCPAVHREMWG